jgi:hypothetical protein
MFAQSRTPSLIDAIIDNQPALHNLRYHLPGAATYPTFLSSTSSSGSRDEFTSILALNFIFLHHNQA